MEESQEKEDKKDVLAFRLYGETDMTYVTFKKGGSLLFKLVAYIFKDPI
jgi:hypothetical protein